MAKYLLVPDPIKLRNLVTRKDMEGDEYTFYHYIQNECLIDTRFGANWKAGRSASQIADAFFEQAPGTWVELETADYDLLKAASEEPQRYDYATRQSIKGYNPMLLQQIGPFIAAIQAGDSNKAPAKSTDKEET